MYRVISSYAAQPVIIPGALAILTAASSECTFDTHAQRLANVGGVGSCLRCVSSARCPTDFFAKYRRSVIAGNKDSDPSSGIATSTEALIQEGAVIWVSQISERKDHASCYEESRS
jgi:hypothetical protein